jgi:hypothetical protein
VPDPNVDAELVPERRGIAGHQLVRIVDDTAHPVRDSAGGVRREVAPLERHDLQVVATAAAPSLGRGRHAARVAAHHDKPFGHGRASLRAALP